MKVMLCVDDDAQYEALLSAAQSSLALGADDHVLVTHVVATLRWTPLRGNVSGWAGTERDILEKVDDFLARTVERVASTGVRAEAFRLEGDVASEISDAARAREVDIIAAGAIGQARGQDFLVGSVAENLVSVSECDLLLARGSTLDEGAELRVTVAIDDTDSSDRAVRSFVERFRVDGAAVEIVHVIPVPPPRYAAAPEDTRSEPTVPPVIQKRADRAVRRATEIFGARGFEPRLALRRGDPAREILDAARDFGANLIVVGRDDAQTGTRLDGWRGTVTERVAHHAPCSVFIAATTGTSREDKDTEGAYERENSGLDDR